MELLDRLYMTFIYENRWRFFTDGFLMTVLLTFASFLGGTIFGALLCALRFAPCKAVRKGAKLLAGLLIQLPTLVLLMVLAYIVFSGAGLSIVIVTIFGFLLKCGAYLSEVFYTAVSGVNSGQAEAAQALGMSGFQAFYRITFPQAVQAAIPLYKNQFVICLQETSLAGTLAVMDLTKASNIVNARTLDAFFSLILVSAVYLLIGFICTSLLGLIGNKKHLGDEENA